MFLKAYRALPQFEGRSQFFTWVYRMTVNRSLNVRRDRARRGEDVLEDPRLELAVAVDARSNPGREAELRQTYARLLRALDALPADMRTTVILVSLQGLSHGEVAVVQKVSEGTDRVAHARGAAPAARGDHAPEAPAPARAVGRAVARAHRARPVRAGDAAAQDPRLTPGSRVARGYRARPAAGTVRRMQSKSTLLLGFLFAAACAGSAPPPAAPAPTAAAPAAPAAAASTLPLVAPGEAKVGDRTKCPVSGDEFVVTADSPHAEYNGKTYYFCCAHCPKAFEAHPEKYVTKS